MVFQSYALYPHMTVRENMAFGLRLRKACDEADHRAARGRRRAHPEPRRLLDR
jgi:ABC-type sugar transport system ATPase subunit